MTEESVISSIRKRPFDGYRGYDPEGGWWISLEESKVLAMNEEWWTETETSIGAKPVAIPKDNKLWMFESGEMHLGPWKNILFGRGGSTSIDDVMVLSCGGGGSGSISVLTVFISTCRFHSSEDCE